MSRPESADLLRISSELRRSQFDKMAHALGWPDTANALRPRSRGRIRWADPHRNGYAAGGGDPDWEDAERLGLAKSYKAPTVSPYVMWHVTPLGAAVVRLRLRAVIEAAGLEVAE